MLLAFDIGNSDVTIGVFLDANWKHIWRIPSSQTSEVYYALKLQNHFLEAGIRTSDIEGVVISSVVPHLTDTLVQVSSALFPPKPLLLGVSVYHRLPVKVLNPYQIGSDLVANAVAAFTLSRSACVAVDFGTALTFTVVDASAEIVGVSIAPGLRTALKSLSQNTAKLFEVPLEFPSSVLGKNTIQAIQAGLLHGYEGMVENMLRKIKDELNGQVTTVLTGGLSGVIPTLVSKVDHVVPTLTLDGLRIIHATVS